MTAPQVNNCGPAEAHPHGLYERAIRASDEEYQDLIAYWRAQPITDWETGAIIPQEVLALRGTPEWDQLPVKPLINGLPLLALELLENARKERQRQRQPAVQPTSSNRAQPAVAPLRVTDQTLFDRVKDSNSSSLITESRIKQPFAYGRNEEGLERCWICTGQDGTDKLRCTEVIRRQHFTGHIRTYTEASRATRDITHDPNHFYHGILVKQGRQEWVLSTQQRLFIHRAETSTPEAHKTPAADETRTRPPIPLSQHLEIHDGPDASLFELALRNYDPSLLRIGSVRQPFRIPGDQRYWICLDISEAPASRPHNLPARAIALCRSIVPLAQAGQVEQDEDTLILRIYSGAEWVTRPDALAIILKLPEPEPKKAQQTTVIASSPGAEPLVESSTGMEQLSLF
jgi:hypothetical protein